uniref:Protein fantom-like n=2 Tax=Macrostomum lignano TaxID=282301 RepID=A0A1I8FVB8_9PLAT
MAAQAEQAQSPVKRSRQDPTRPLASSWNAANSAHGSSGHILDKGIVSRWSRDDLEDKYLSLYQDHSKLKERFREQEEKIHEFKLVLKKRQDEIRQQQAKVGAGAAELRATDQVAKLEMRNIELEKQVAHLQQRLTLLQSKLESPTIKRTSTNTRVLQPPPGLRPQRSLGRQDDTKLRLQAENGQLLAEIESLKDKLYAQEMEHQRRVQDLHSELETARLQVGNDKRLTMQDDLEKVKLQREVREKSAMVEHLQTRCDAHEERERQALETSSRLQNELERLTMEGRRRDQEAESLKESSTAGQTLRRRVMELEHALEDANKEAKLLKEANDKLMGSAFDVERERQWQAREAALQAQLKKLEAVGHRDVNEKGQFLDRLEEERNHGEEVERELSALRIKCFELQEQNESLRQKNL